MKVECGGKCCIKTLLIFMEWKLVLGVDLCLGRPQRGDSSPLS